MNYDSVYNQTASSVDMEWSNCGSPDDVRILVSYADPTACESMDIVLDPSGEIGFQVGDASSGLLGVGDYGEVEFLTLELSGPG